MTVGFFATKIQALVMREREDIEAAYERYPDSSLFWCFVDLIDSSNYRIANGPRLGYVRAETFFSLIYAVIGPCPPVRLIKEIGDAVLLSSDELRALFESVILIDQAAYQMADVAGTSAYPFGVRAALGFGPAKRLIRRHEDYVGTPIDELSRVASVRSQNANIYIHQDAYQTHADILNEYGEFLSVSQPISLGAEASKAMLRPVFYREISVNRSCLVDFRRHFSYWK